MPAASSVPSSSNAMVQAPCSWRACPAAIRFSRRSSIHFSGAGTLRAASIRHMSSRIGVTFCPKPPPVSRMITRMWCSGRPSRREQNSRTSWGAWVPAQIVSSPPDHSTTMPRVSMGTGGVGLLVDGLGDDVGRRGARLLDRLAGCGPPSLPATLPG